MCEKSTKFARGTVWWVKTKNDNMCSTAQQKDRPFLIVSNDEYNIKFKKVTCIPLSHQDKYETFGNAVATVFENKKCYVLVDQIRQLDFKYLSNYAFTMNSEVMAEIDTYILKFYTNSFYFEDDNEETTTDTNVVDNTDSNVGFTDDISKIEYRITNLESDYNNLKTAINNQTTEIIRLTKNINNMVLNGVINKIEINDECQKSDKVVSEPDKNNNEVISKPVTNKKSVITNKSTKRKKSKSALPYGYFSHEVNNIAFWNDLVLLGKDAVMEKYNLVDNVAFSRRKNRVKVYLTNKGYDLSKNEVLNYGPSCWECDTVKQD